MILHEHELQQLHRRYVKDLHIPAVSSAERKDKDNFVGKTTAIVFRDNFPLPHKKEKEKWLIMLSR